ncbi:hypothetical protein AAC387_Pa08g1657 [Persea americana]
MAGAAQGQNVSLKETPTWAVALVCFFLIFLSLLIEHVLHLITKFLKRRNRKSLSQAHHKIMEELMLFGFVSLFLTIMGESISKICIPKSMGDNFLPCKNTTISSDITEEPKCQEQGKISLLSQDGVNQLHYLIFVLALFHILSCVITLGLGKAKMKKWESWEGETRTLEYEFSNDPRRFKLTHQTSFGRRHLKCWSNQPLLLWPTCLIRLFTGSVSRVDYLALRHGFIEAFISPGGKFNFHKFLSRALDKDFKVVVGISLWIWVSSVLFIFFSAYGFYSYYWLPFIPLMMVSAVGTKLQFIITTMCLESRNESVVARGTVLVKPNDNLFWFGRPQFLLHLIHLLLFQNSFELAFFTWTWYEFGLRSCFHKEIEDIVIRISVGILVQILVGYVILPLYVLVTQMGSSMNKVVFTEHVSRGLKNWHAIAKRSLTPSISNSAGPSPEPSPPYMRSRLSDAKELRIREHESPSTSNSAGPSVEPSPPYMRSRLSDAKELKIREPESPSTSNSAGPSVEPSPPYMRSRLSAAKELKIREHESPSIDGNSGIEETNDEATETNTTKKGYFDGEISFGWRNGQKQ